MWTLNCLWNYTEEIERTPTRKTAVSFATSSVKTSTRFQRTDFFALILLTVMLRLKRLLEWGNNENLLITSNFFSLIVYRIQWQCKETWANFNFQREINRNMVCMKNTSFKLTLSCSGHCSKNKTKDFWLFNNLSKTKSCVQLLTLRVLSVVKFSTSKFLRYYNPIHSVSIET